MAAGSEGRRPTSSQVSDDAGYRLDDLRVFSRVVNYVAENYVDPKRIDPKAMVIAALEQVEKTVAEVMVESDAATGKMKVTVGKDSREFEIGSLKNVYSTRPVMGDVMAFIQDHLVAHKALRDIEYAAVNGMLSTLDPHSILLEPKFFKEMKLQTRGEFGGLGFVIAMRDGNLTVVKVLKNTPAQRAGVRAKDVITKIEDQSTINMDLQDAVDRLRGRPSTKVAITLLRSGWSDPKRMTLIREMINVETVPFAKLLDNGVGYVKVSQFSANTGRDLLAALNAEKAQAGGQLKGLILDLRGNPGGLLEQAIQVSDRFLGSGVIVKTVGQGERHGSPEVKEVKEARTDRDDVVGLPLVVLVNNNSASASEIVAGALKNNNRALVVGRHTFGKGSVQVLYDDFGDTVRSGESPALKLTIAQYLTPGDVSIQEVGITPDVLLLPGRVLKDAVNVFAPQPVLGEADLDRHFVNPADTTASGQREGRRRQEKAPLELRYLLDEKEDQVAKALKKEQARSEPDLTPEQVEDDEADANPDELVEDYQIRFAKELLGRYPFPERQRLLEAARGFVTERRNEEDGRLQQKLEQLGINWSSSSAGGTPRAVVAVSPAPGKRLRAGQNSPWTVTVENVGEAPFYRLRAWSLVEKEPLFDRREFVFGLVNPGEKRSWTVPLKLPPGFDSRRDEVTLHFEEDSGRAPPDFSTTLEVLESPRPIFAFSTQIEDESTGNGDGLVARGEEISLRVDVKNQGHGISGDKTYVSLKNLGDEKIFIKKGRVVLGSLKPGEVKSATLQLEVKAGFKLETVPLRLMVVDEKLDEYISDKMELPVQSAPPVRSAAAGAVRATGGTDLLIRSGASRESAPIALARKDATLPVLARYGDFYKVEWQKGRSGFVTTAEVQSIAKARRENAATEVWQREPPRIVLTPDPASGAPIVDGEKWHIEGKAFLPSSSTSTMNRLRDVFIFVNGRKVFFKVVPEANTAQQVDFTADVPLKPGNNVVTVFAREDDEFQSRRTVVVTRRQDHQVAESATQAGGKP